MHSTKTLEYWLTKATDPYIDKNERTGFICGFYEKINQDLEGPQLACRLISHKMQSPNEIESLLALSTLDACVRNCGARFHNEMSKFRFLNELIKILSPKYLGPQTSDKVKQKCTELLYSWQKSMRHLPKLKQAYDMLKDRKVIKHDPTYMDEIMEAPIPVPEPRVANFEDVEKSKLLACLLKSKKSDDLQAANRLIKSMVKTENERVERLSRRDDDLQTARSNSKLLSEMIDQFQPVSTASQDRDLMNDLSCTLRTFRAVLYRHAGESAGVDECALVQLLSMVDFDAPPMESPVLGNFDAKSFDSSQDPVYTDDVGLIALGLSGPNSSIAETCRSLKNDEKNGDKIATSVAANSNKSTLSLVQTLNSKGLNALDQLSDVLIQQNLPPGTPWSVQIERQKSKIPMRDLNRPSSSDGNSTVSLSVLDHFGCESLPTENDGSNLHSSNALAFETFSQTMPRSLDGVFVQLADIKPSGKNPLMLFDKADIKLVLHYSSNKPRQDITTTVVSISSTHSQPVTDIRFRVNTDTITNVLVKLLPPSGNQLPGFNPIFSQQSVTQVLLLATTAHSPLKIMLDYTFEYSTPLEHSISGSFEVILLDY